MYEIATYEFPANFSAALLVITGAYGNGDERKTALTADGYDYDTVQKCVNDLMGMIEKYG